MNRRQVLGILGGIVGSAAMPTARGQESGYAPLGRVEIPNATEAVVADNGRWAFVAVGSGFVVVDLDDPAMPSVVATRENLMADRELGPMAGIIDLKLHGERLVVAGPGNPTRDPVPTGFALFDVSDPPSPDRLAFYASRRPIHNAFIERNRVYLTQGPAVDIVDISDADPERVGSIELTEFDRRWSDVPLQRRAPHDVWVRDRIAHVPMWDAGTLIADASDPASPTVIAHIEAQPAEKLGNTPDDGAGREGTEPPGNHHYAQASVDGRLLAIGKESWDARPGDGAGGPSGVELWDTSAPTEPVKLSEVHPPRAQDETRRGTWTTAHNFDLVGDRLYTAWYQGGVRVHDISDPGDPIELAWWRRPNEAAFWSAVGVAEGFFVASSAGSYLGSSLADGLFTFPTEPGDQDDPPSVLQPAASPSTFATPRPTPTTDPDPPPAATSEGQPGFGLLAGGVGLAAGLGWLLRDRNRGR